MHGSSGWFEGKKKPQTGVFRYYDPDTQPSWFINPKKCIIFIITLRASCPALDLLLKTFFL